VLAVILAGFVALSGCTSNSPISTTPVTPTTTQIQLQEAGPTVTIQNFAFTPATVSIPKGTTVSWVNKDSSNHVIVNDAQGSIAQGALFTSNSLLKGESYLFKFETPGTYPYHCSIHPSMKGTIVVT
jgi:plastocyanin